MHNIEDTTATGSNVHQMSIPRFLMMKKKIVSNPKDIIGNVVVWVKMMITVKMLLVALRNIRRDLAYRSCHSLYVNIVKLLKER